MTQTTLSTAKCYESATNPRGTKFEGAAFDELVASIKQKGVLVPVLARRKPKGGKEFEVVAGNRRLRAAIEAGLTEIPALVKELTDEEAREAQIIENLQRADIHPLEEGVAYRDLIEVSKYDVAAVAAHVGKSATYVRERLLLCGLIPAAKKALRDNKISAGHAALIARLDTDTQKLATEDCADEYNPLTIPDLREWIQTRELQHSADAPWANDEQMKAALGGCGECEGKGGDLFGKKAAEACPNPTCYARRMKAYIAIKLQDPELLRLSTRYGNSETEGVIGRNGYEALTAAKDKCDFEQKGIVVEGEGLGKILRVCLDSDCKKHATSHNAGYAETSAQKKKRQAERKKERQKEQKKRDKDTAEMKAAVEKMSWPLSEKHLDALITMAIVHHASHDTRRQVCVRRNIEAPKQKDWHGRDYSGALEKAAGEMKPKEKVGFLFELLTPSYSNNYGNESRNKAIKSV